MIVYQQNCETFMADVRENNIDVVPQVWLCNADKSPINRFWFKNSVAVFILYGTCNKQRESQNTLIIS